MAGELTVASKLIPLPSPVTGSLVNDDYEHFSALRQLMSGVCVRLESQHITAPVKGQVIDLQEGLALVSIKMANGLVIHMQLPFAYQEFMSLGIKCHIKLGQQLNTNTVMFTIDLYKLNQQNNMNYYFVGFSNNQQINSVTAPLKYVQDNRDPIFSLVITNKS